MDIYNMYIGDCSSYASLRNSVFRDYEKFPYGSLEGLNSNKKYFNNTVQERKNQSNKTSTTSKNCPFCKEQKKRPLGAYLRKRELAKRDDKIFEEAEELEEEEEEEVGNNHHHHHHHHNTAANVQKNEKKRTESL